MLAIHAENFFFEIKNFRLHADNCELFTREVEWCGRIIDAEGSLYNPRGIEFLIAMPAPLKAADLSQFVHAASWMRYGIVNFNAIIAPLHNLLKSVAAKYGSKKSNSRNVRLEARWVPEEQQEIMVAKEDIATRIRTAHFDPEQQMCL